jgi:hypothetical protein
MGAGALVPNGLALNRVLTSSLPKGQELSREERGYVVDVICRRIEREVAASPGTK